ncbi:MAG: FHA domain-containing protein [Anaerolineae bacterium]|nr:FHA domain-containing protein [Anaerolineae bacterium]
MDDDNIQTGDETYIISSENAADIMGTIFSRFITDYKPFGFERAGTELTYHPLPYLPGPEDEYLLKTPWRIELELQTDQEKTMVVGLDLYGDIILGRGESQEGRIILDLEPYGAKELGISREHLMLRPSEQRLFAIEQGSTNGTTINGVSAGRGIVIELHNDDLLALGNMILILRIIKMPDTDPDQRSVIF